MLDFDDLDAANRAIETALLGEGWDQATHCGWRPTGDGFLESVTVKKRPRPFLVPPDAHDHEQGESWRLCMTVLWQRLSAEAKETTRTVPDPRRAIVAEFLSVRGNGKGGISHVLRLV